MGSGGLPKHGPLWRPAPGTARRILRPAAAIPSGDNRKRRPARAGRRGYFSTNRRAGGESAGRPQGNRPHGAPPGALDRAPASAPWGLVDGTAPCRAVSLLLARLRGPSRPPCRQAPCRAPALTPSRGRRAADGTAPTTPDRRQSAQRGCADPRVPVRAVGASAGTTAPNTTPKN